jgi:hypothetical protein
MLIHAGGLFECTLHVSGNTMLGGGGGRGGRGLPGRNRSQRAAQTPASSTLSQKQLSVVMLMLLDEHYRASPLHKRLHRQQSSFSQCGRTRW